MQIRVPLSDDKNHSLTMLVIYLPDGTQVKVKTGKPIYDFRLPAGVSEDEIDVYSIFLGQDQKPAFGCGPVCIKRATKVTAAEAAAEAAAPSIEATEPPATTLIHVEPEAAALHTVTNHANDKHDAGTTTVPESTTAASAPAADVPAPAADAPIAAAAATPVADVEPDAPAVEPAAPAVEPAAPVAGPISEPAENAPAVSAAAPAVDVKPAKTVKHTSNANIAKFEPTYDPKHGRKS